LNHCAGDYYRPPAFDSDFEAEEPPALCLWFIRVCGSSDFCVKCVTPPVFPGNDLRMPMPAVLKRFIPNVHILSLSAADCYRPAMNVPPVFCCSFHCILSCKCQASVRFIFLKSVKSLLILNYSWRLGHAHETPI
ncbi:MAG: hypothetical protein J6D38_08595, partial [Solobacterium sp.]|nr:hypothetical protein [Solobacterium sp.]